MQHPMAPDHAREGGQPAAAATGTAITRQRPAASVRSGITRSAHPPRASQAPDGSICAAGDLIDSPVPAAHISMISAFLARSALIMRRFRGDLSAAGPGLAASGSSAVRAGRP
jgi:hypothetical protein